MTDIPSVSRRAALAGAAGLGSAAFLSGAAEAAPDEQPAWARPDPGTRAMLREISAANTERVITRLVSFGTRNTLSAQDDPVRGIGAARDWLLAEFRRIAATSGGRMTVELQSYVQPVAPRVPVPTTITNVVATLPGSTAPDRTYVVSGHYDSMCTDVVNAVGDAPGANDDASGVAVVLECARVMATRTFDATIVFLAVAGEEQGLFGSNFYATTARAAGRRIDAMFTNDIVGSSTGQNGERDPYTVRLFAEGLPTTPAPVEADMRRFGGETEFAVRQLARYVRDVGQGEHTGMRVRVIHRRDRYGRGGDHIPFLAQGYPAVRFTEPHEDYRHQHQDVRVEDGVQWGDLPRFVDFGYVARVARVNAAALAALATAPAAPAGALIVPNSFTNDTTLRWTANTEADLAGYEIVSRPTTAEDWTDTIAVGDVTEFVVRDVSKDNLYFGIRAVDSTGHRSPVSFPRPA